MVKVSVLMPVYKTKEEYLCQAIESNLDNYSLIIKLHAKRDMPQGAIFNCWDMSEKKWREYALSMLKTPIGKPRKLLKPELLKPWSGI